MSSGFQLGLKPQKTESLLNKLELCGMKVGIYDEGRVYYRCEVGGAPDSRKHSLWSILRTKHSAIVDKSVHNMDRGIQSEFI